MRSLLIFLFFHISLTINGQTSSVEKGRLVLDSLSQLNETLSEEYRFDEALQMLYQAEDDYPTIFRENPDLLADLYYQLGKTLNEKGDYSKAEPLLLKVKDIRSKRLGKNHPKYVYSLNRLALLYNNMGDYSKAEALYLEGKGIKAIIFGKEHPYYANSLNNLATLYYEMGNYEKAEQFYLETRIIDEKTIGKHHFEYAKNLSRLAQLYSDMGDYSKAEPLFLEAKNVFENSNDKISRDYANNNDRLANLYSNMKDFKKSEALLLEALEITEKTLDKNHPDYAESANTLASVYHATQQYEKADSLFQLAIKIRENTLGKGHPEYAQSLNDLASLYQQIGHIEKASKLYEQLYLCYKMQLAAYYPALSETSKLLYLAKLEEDINEAYYFAHLNKSIPNTIQNINLLTKGLALEGSTNARLNLLTTKDSLLTSKYKAWIDVRKKIANTYTLSLKEQEKRGISLPALQEKAELLEATFARASSSLTKQQQRKSFSFLDLKSSLREGEATIDIIQYSPIDEDGEMMDSILYAALIVQPSFEKAQFVFLSDETQVKKILKASIKKGGSNYIENPAISHLLYKTIWEPLIPYLIDVEKIYLSPSGLLHQVAFDALRTNPQENVLLMDHYEVAYCGNLREFVQEEKERPNKKEIVLVGGAEYSLDSLSLSYLAKPELNQKIRKVEDDVSLTEESISRSIADDSTRSAIRFNYLPGTHKEVESIAKLFQSKKWDTKVLLKKEALEDNIKILSGERAPTILHIATHGYFFTAENKKEEKADINLRHRIKYAKNPLFRSGLVFTGVNYSWEKGKVISGIDDGVLTAYEISNMDLLNTNLVVLSACETGLGDIHNEEGVFGLQRAFKTAGVDNMIISLWKIPDQETSELMQLFYQNYLEGQTPREALRQAQMIMREKYSAYYWAGFILIE